MIIFGIGSFAKVIYYSFPSIFDNDKNIYFVDAFSQIKEKENDEFWDNKRFFFYKSVRDLNSSLNKSEKFAVAIGNNFGFERFSIIKKLKEKGFEHEKLWHSSAKLLLTKKIPETTLIMPSVTLMPMVSLKKGVILNTGSTIDHEVEIGNGCHIMGSSYIGGRTTVGDWTTIGSNSTIFPDLKIGNNCFIGAGSVVRCDIPDNSVFVGNPAKYLKKSRIIPKKEDLVY